jgi:hypothetical protein
MKVSKEVLEKLVTNDSVAFLAISLSIKILAIKIEVNNDVIIQ